MRGLPSQDRLQAEYELIAAALRPHVDILLAETLATVGEAHAALNAAAQAAPGECEGTQGLHRVRRDRKSVV